MRSLHLNLTSLTLLCMILRKNSWPPGNIILWEAGLLCEVVTSCPSLYQVMTGGGLPSARQFRVAGSFFTTNWSSGCSTIRGSVTSGSAATNTIEGSIQHEWSGKPNWCLSLDLYSKVTQSIYILLNTMKMWICCKVFFFFSKSTHLNDWVKGDAIS